MRDELCLQKRMDQQWAGLLATMAPACVQGGTLLKSIDNLLDLAIGSLQAGLCPPTDITLPDTIEDLLVDIAVATTKIELKLP